MKKLSTKIIQLVKNNKGQGLVEYSLILVLIAIVVFATLGFLGVQLNGTYETINSGVTNAGK
jgi:pilus assembly protein Flp/PilA